DVQQTHPDTIFLKHKETRMRMQWFGDAPAFDIARGDVLSDSKRGLIGVRWKTMQAGTSVHVSFNLETTDSIVVIGDPDAKNLSCEIKNRQRLESFELELSTSIGKYHLCFQPNRTTLSDRI